MDNLKTLEEVKEWLNTNTNCIFNIDFLVYIVSNGIIKPIENSKYAIDDFTNLFIVKEDNAFMMQTDKLLVKESIVKANGNFLPKKSTITATPKKYKIANLGGNKLKVIKLS